MQLTQKTRSIKSSILSTTCKGYLAEHYWKLAELLIEQCDLEAANRAQLISLRLRPERFDRSIYRYIIDARRSAGRDTDVNSFQTLLESIGD